MYPGKTEPMIKNTTHSSIGCKGMANNDDYHGLEMYKNHANKQTNKNLRCGNRKGLLSRNDQTHHRMGPKTMESIPPSKRNTQADIQLRTRQIVAPAITQPQRDICNQTQPPWNVATMDVAESIPQSQGNAPIETEPMIKNTTHSSIGCNGMANNALRSYRAGP